MPHRGGATDPDELARGRRGRGARDLPAAELLRLPRAGARPGARPRTTPARCRSRTSTRSRSACSRRRATTAARSRSARARARATTSRYGGPHYGFLAAQAGLHPPDARPDRRRDDRRRRAGAASSSRCRPASSTSAARRRPRTSRRTRRCSRSAGLVHLSLARAAGAARGGGDLHGARRATRRSGWRRPARARVSGAGNVQGVRRPRRTERPRGRRGARASAASTRATRSGATTTGWTTRCSSPSPRSARRRTSTGSPRCSRRSATMKLIYERSQPGRRASTPPAPRPARSPEVPAELARARAAAPARGRRARARPPLHRALDRGTSAIDTGFYPLGSCTMKHNPRVNERVVAPARLPRPPPAPGGGRRAGRARADVAAAGDPRRGRAASHARLAPAGRRLAGRADRADAHARLLRRPRRGRAAPRDRRPRHGARHEPGERDDGRLRARRRQDRRARQRRRRRPARQGRTADRRADAHEPVHARPLRREHRGDRSGSSTAPARSCTTTART